MASWEDDRILVDEDIDLQESQSQTHRLANRTSNSTIDFKIFDNYDDDGTLTTMFSRLSFESFDIGGDADEEFSEHSIRGSLFLESDDDDHDETPVLACYSLPATPLQEQRCQSDHVLFKQYLSDNHCRKLRRKRKVLRRKKWEEKRTSKSDDDENSFDVKMNMRLGERVLSQCNNSFSGESEGGLKVITRPKGGRRSLCMDMEEVKACRDLGFDLEHQHMFDKATPSWLSLSASTLDTNTTSSGGSSPISNWRISSPGDDPKDVKSRLKIWAQAVALASSSSSRHGGSS